MTVLRLGGRPATRRASSFTLFGDSMTYMNGPTFNVPGSTASDQGFFNWARFYMGNRVQASRNLGVSGEDTGQMLARLGPAVADDAGRAIVLAGTNDIKHGLSAAQTQTNLRAIYGALVGSGKEVVAVTIIPRGLLSASEKKQLLAVNRWIRTYCRDNAAMILCDPYPYMMDKNGDPAAGVLQAADSLHPNRAGAQIMGRVLASVLDPLIPGSLFLSTGRGQGDPYNHLDYSVFDGTAGGTTAAVAGTTVGGSVAQGWQLETYAGTGTVTGMLVPRTDGIPGYWQQIAVAGGNQVQVGLRRWGRNEGVNGQGAVARIELDASIDDWVGCNRLSCEVMDSDNSNYGEVMTASGDLPMPAPGYGILESVRVLPTTDGSGQLCRLNWTLDSGTVRVGMCAIRYPDEV